MFYSCWPEQAGKQTAQLSVIWEAMMIIRLHFTVVESFVRMENHFSTDRTICVSETGRLVLHILQTITWTNADALWIEPFETNYRDIIIAVHVFSNSNVVENTVRKFCSFVSQESKVMYLWDDIIVER